MLPILFKVQAGYTDKDQSRFRAIMMMNTLAISLKQQTDQNFCVTIMQPETDKFREKRLESVREYLADEAVDQPRIVVEVPDDDFLSKDFVAKIRAVQTPPDQNCFITVPNGYCLFEEKLRIFRNQPNRITVSVLLNPAEPIRWSIEGPTDFLWIHHRHNYSDSMEVPEMKTGAVISSMNWPGWNRTIISRYCGLVLKTASAEESSLVHPKRYIRGGGKGGRLKSSGNWKRKKME